MLVDIKTYKNKVRGCWLGKNIGGTLGAPFECVRGTFDIAGYTQDMSDGAAPNDDLDLQLVWLNVAERYGRNIDAVILSEYWLSYIVGNWSEYGAGKNNLAFGFTPPISGWYNNHNRDSCGAFIRSEIWSCLHPGHPEKAVKYAYEDAIVDHSGEGVYAEIFTAAIQSAAFAETDKWELIKIGLSYIPDKCGIRKAVDSVMQSYNTGLDWKAARKKVLQTLPGSFGMYNGYEDREPESDVPFGKPGYDAPSNIGILVIGWLYGEDDFGKSICIAAGCGEDGDCTAASLGAILGIISGANRLPDQWTKPIGDKIKTISINLTEEYVCRIPATITELTNRVCAIMPVFMENYCDTMNENGITINLSTGKALYQRPTPFGTFSTVEFKETLKNQPFGLTFKNVLFEVTVTCKDGVIIKEGEPLRLSISIKNFLRKQQWLVFRWFAPEAWEFTGGREFSLNLDQPHGGFGTAKFETALVPQKINKAMYCIVLEIMSVGRLSRLYVPITLTNSVDSM